MGNGLYAAIEQARTEWHCVGLLGAVLLTLETSALYYLSPMGELDGTAIRWADMKALAALDLALLIASGWLCLRFFRKRTYTRLSVKDRLPVEPPRLRAVRACTTA